MGKHRIFNFLLLALIAILSACATGTTEDKTGDLELTIQGLSGVDANVIVTGPNSFNQTLKASGKLENLTAGNYTITAQDVVQGETFFPDKREQTIEVKANETTTVTLTYSKQATSAGSLEVTINGLPVGTNADVTISGPNSFNQQLSSSSVLSNLTPSDYQLTAKALTMGSDSYTPTPMSQTIGIAAGGKTDLTVTYTKQSSTVGQLAVTFKGLPTGLTATATVTGPNSFSEMLTASQTLNDLSPGEYTVTASKVEGTYPYNPSPKTQKLNIVAGESANALLAYVPTIREDKSSLGDLFGSSLAIDGDFMVIGAPNHDSGSLSDDGAAYLYERTATGEWTFLKELIPEPKKDPALASLGTLEPNGISDNDAFGASVAISGDTVVVGAPTALTSRVCQIGGACTDIRAGAAYVFERNEGGSDNFGYVTTLIAQGIEGLRPSDQDNFGTSVAISGNVVVVGSPGEPYYVDGLPECVAMSGNAGGCAAGAAYLFELDTQTMPTRVTRIHAADGQGGDRFGTSVAISGNTLVVGAWGDVYDADGDGTEECAEGNLSECFIGSVYIFEQTTNSPEWEQVKKLFSKRGTAFDGFGETVDISEDTVVIGLSGDNDRSQTEVVAHVFQRNEGAWGEGKELSTKGVLRGDRLSSVAIHGDSVVVGIPYSSGDVNEDGTLDCRLSGTTYTGTECFPGAVAIFQRDQGGINNFGLVKTFVASDGANFENLGLSVGISANTLVAGAPGHADIGAVYVLEP